jgi:D-aminopeptidase
LFVAFSTGNDLHDNRNQLEQIRVLPPSAMDQLFHGVADAVEEAIANALCAAHTTTGFNGRTAYALPTERMQTLVRAAGFSQSPQATQPLTDTRLP